MRRPSVLIALLFALPAHGVVIDWVEVGDPGNACDTQSQGCFGAVGYVCFRVAMIPEPSTALLLATGLAGLAATGQRRRL